MHKTTKSSTHKQSRHFTLMLVPYSSGKTRSLRVPHFMFHVTMIALVGTICTLTIFYIRTNYFKSRAAEFNNSLQQSQRLNNILQQDKSILEQDKSKLEQEWKNMDRQLQEAELKNSEDAAVESDQIEEKMDYYEQKVKELEEKLDELQRAKEDIYNQLSQRDYIPQIRESNYVIPVTPVFANLDSALTNPELDTKYAGLEARISGEMLAYNDLMSDLMEIKPYLTNYPTIWPVNGIVTSEVGFRQNPFGGTGEESHTGIDISVPTGTAVKAAGGGVVKFSGVKGGYGYLVIISHSMGIESYYAHNSQLLVSEGESISRGQVIARSGSSGLSTGPHVHFEIRVDGNIKNPRSIIKEAI